LVSVAVTGKGGTGKTILSALLVKFASKTGKRVLAVDADPDSNLPEALGVEPEKTLGEVRELFQMSRDDMVSHDKEVWLEGKLMEVIYEADSYDLLVMGRPEGAGCYCYTNNLLKSILRKFMSHYDAIIIDTEAGLEHFSRQTIKDVDYLLVVTDASMKGFRTAERIRDLVKELNLDFRGIFLVANKINDMAKKVIEDYANEHKFDLIAILPFDEKLAELDLRGVPVVKLNGESELVNRVEEISGMIFG
jgi:CO dehydrogenase maturation factor